MIVPFGFRPLASVFTSFRLVEMNTDSTFRRNKHAEI